MLREFRSIPSEYPEERLQGARWLAAILNMIKIGSKDGMYPNDC